MADESYRRRITWAMYGCNVLAGKNPRSAPMSFWTEQDVLAYIKQMNIPIASVYGDIVQTADRGGAYNDRSKTNRMYVLHVRRTPRKRTEQIPTDVLYSSETMGLLHQPIRSETSPRLYQRAI